uniref:Reverse transcriptase domain-containing protein n=1 Tax=Tanacetum cinerariifolium TaxID=118510 RepID=A0A699HE07_TANCI|nr:reverse transcriptase domain-containing protein [Tanacetum cinerariifolium]
MSTRSNSSYLFSSLRDPESLIRRRNLGEPLSLFDFEEVMNNNQEMPPQNDNGPPPMVRPNGKAPRKMEELCQPSINGRGGPIALIPIQATDFGLRHHMIQQVQNTKFLSKYFPPSMVTKLRNEITKFEQKPNESLFEAWERYKLSIDRCPNHNMLLVTQIDTFYNGLTLSRRDTINAAAGGTFMQKTPKECYELIDNITVHHNHWDTFAIRDETSRNISSTSTTESPEVVRQLEMTNTNFLEMMRQIQTVTIVDTKCKTCGGPHSFTECPVVGGYTQETAYATTGRGNNFNQALTYQAPTHQPQVATPSNFQGYMKANGAITKNMQTRMTSLTTSNIELKNMFGQFMKMNTPSSSGTGSLPSNTVLNPWADLKAITTKSGVTLAGPSTPPPPSKKVDREPETITNQVLTGTPNNGPPLVVQPTPASTSSTPISSFNVPEVKKDTVQPSTENIQPPVAQTQVPIDEPVVAPKPKPTIPYPSRANKQKLSTTPVNENCSAVILKKLPEKLGDPDKFLIPCDFPELDECLALADLGASINLMPLSIWRKLSLPELSSTQMILELADRSTTRPAGIAEGVFVKVGKFHFLTDFVVVDYVVHPRIPLILGRPFLRTERALIDVYGEELTLRIDDEAITFNVGQTSKYSYNDAESINRIDVIDVACEEYVQEIKACLTSKSIPSGIDDTDFDLERDIRLLEELLNKDPSSSSLPPKELNVEEIKTVKSSIDELPKLELKYFQIPINLQDQEKTTFTRPYGTFAYRRMPFGLCDAPSTFQRCMMAIFHDMIEKTMEEKYHFMVKEGIVLGHKISKSGIEVDRAKVDVIAKLPHPTSVKALKYLLAKQDAKSRLLWWILLLQEFDVIIRDKKERRISRLTICLD